MSRDKGQVQELLVTLYLRLNGYFTSGFIVHSPRKGRNRTEIDVLGVRFPNNAEPEREIHTAPEIDASTVSLDLVVAEVKSKGRELAFNEALRSSPASVASVLRWAGLYSEGEIDDLSEQFVAALSSHGVVGGGPPTIEGPRGTRIRGLLFSPERVGRSADDPWFIAGEQVFGHISRCLRPVARRSGCSVSYDFGLWGPGLAPLVRFFKQSNGNSPGDLKGLLEFLEKSSD